MALFKLEDLCEIVKGKTPIQNSESGKYPLLTTAEDYLTCSHYDFDVEAVCIPMVSSTGHGHASLNRLHYIKGKFALGSILATVFPKDATKLKTKYLFIYLTLLKDELLVSQMKGSANVSLTISVLRSLQIEVPKMSVQIEVIKQFEKTEKHYDKLKVKFKTQLSDHSDFVISVLAKAFSGELVQPNINAIFPKELVERLNKSEKWTVNKTEIPFQVPPNWLWVKTAQIGENLGQKKPKGRFTYIDVASIDKEKGKISESLQILGANNAPSRARKVAKKGNILFSTVRPNLKNIAIVEEDFDPELIVSTAFIVIQTLEGINNNYIYYFLRSDHFRRYVESKMSGVSYPSISDSKFKNGIVPLAPPAEQDRIVYKIKQLMDFSDTLKVSIFKCINDCEELLAAVLLKMLSSSLTGKYLNITSPFKFNLGEKEKKMKSKQNTMKKGALLNVDMEILISQFKDQPFTFTEIEQKTDVDYEVLKSFVFNELEVRHTKGKPFLKLFFDEKKDSMLFKIVSK